MQGDARQCREIQGISGQCKAVLGDSRHYRAVQGDSGHCLPRAWNRVGKVIFCHSLQFRDLDLVGKTCKLGQDFGCKITNFTQMLS